MLELSGIGFPASPRVWNVTLPGLPWLTCLVSNITFDSFSCLLEQASSAPIVSEQKKATSLQACSSCPAVVLMKPVQVIDDTLTWPQLWALCWHAMRLDFHRRRDDDERVVQTAGMCVVSVVSKMSPLCETASLPTQVLMSFAGCRCQLAACQPSAAPLPGGSSPG